MNTQEPDWKNMGIAELEKFKNLVIKAEKENGCLNTDTLFKISDSPTKLDVDVEILRQQLQMLWRSNNGQYVDTTTQLV